MVPTENKERLAFSRRLHQALDDIPECPQSRGRAVWLAKKVPFKVSAKAAGKWLNGDSMPTRENMASLARMLRVSKSWLGEGEGAKHASPEGDGGLRAQSHLLLESIPEEHLETVVKILGGLADDESKKSAS